MKLAIKNVSTHSVRPYLQYLGRDLNLSPGKTLTAKVRRSPRKDFDTGQYYDVINSSELPYYYNIFLHVHQKLVCMVIVGYTLLTCDIILPKGGE